MPVYYVTTSSPSSGATLTNTTMGLLATNSTRIAFDSYYPSFVREYTYPSTGSKYFSTITSSGERLVEYMGTHSHTRSVTFSCIVNTEQIFLEPSRGIVVGGVIDTNPFFTITPPSGPFYDIPITYSVLASSGAQAYEGSSFYTAGRISMSFPLSMVNDSFSAFTIVVKMEVPDGYQFYASSGTGPQYNHTPDVSRNYVTFAYSSDGSVANSLISAGGANSSLDSATSDVSSSLGDYESATDTSDQYDAIKDEIFDFDTNVFLQIASTSTLFGSMVTSMFTALGDLSSALTFFLILALISAIIGIARVFGGD